MILEDKMLEINDLELESVEGGDTMGISNSLSQMANIGMGVGFLLHGMEGNSIYGKNAWRSATLKVQNAWSSMSQKVSNWWNAPVPEASVARAPVVPEMEMVPV